MTDLLGIELSIGDEVCYANGGKQDDYLNRGTIIEFSVDGESCMIRSSKGTKQRNYRGSGKILSLEMYRTTHPELFV